MITYRNRLLVATSALLVTTPAFSGEAGVTLYGVTIDGGFIEIDLDTGQATDLFDVGTGGTLAYDPVSRIFGILSIESEPGSVVTFGLDGMPPNSAPVVGLPAGQERTGGIGYSGVPGSFFIPFGITGTVVETRIARVLLDGTVAEVSVNIGLGDNDGVLWDEANSRTLVHDYNATDGFPRLAELQDVFTIPMFIPVANPPSDGSLGDTAVHPLDGRIFIISFDGAGGRLIELIGETYVECGAFNTGSPVTGIAFVASPGCNAADVAEPFGTLNFFDVAAFIGLYNAGAPAADLAAPLGSLNFFDVAEYITQYNAGCP